MKLAYLLCLIPSLALATPPATPENPATNYSSSGSFAESNSHSNAAASATSNANQSQLAQANNEGNTQTVTTERSAPAIGQGSLLIGSCGAGVNAGGSGAGGAGFLGVVWTPADCKLLLAAQAFLAIGMPDEACRMVNGIKAVRKRYKALGIDAPTCDLPKTTTAPAPSCELPACVTKEVLDQRDRKLIERIGK